MNGARPLSCLSHVSGHNRYVKLLVAILGTVASAVVLAVVHKPWVEIGATVLLVAAIAGVARNAFRLASDPPRAERDSGSD